MYTVHSISPVSSGARGGAPVYRVSSTRTAQSVQTSGAVKKAPATPSAQTSQPAAAQGLPIGFLQSVAQPSSSNAQASVDYQDLRTALDSGNLTAAHQAYSRLQTDLYLPQMSAMA